MFTVKSIKRDRDTSELSQCTKLNCSIITGLVCTLPQCENNAKWCVSLFFSFPSCMPWPSVYQKNAKRCPKVTLMSESGILWREVSDGYRPNASYLLYSVLKDADEREWDFVERGK